MDSALAAATHSSPSGFHDHHSPQGLGRQAMPRQVWLAPEGKQLVQWPVYEVDSLRGGHVNDNVTNKLVKAGGHFEVARLTSPAQADVEASFPGGGHTDGARGADARGGVRSFRMWVLASDDLKEKTAVFFRVFKHARTARTSCSCATICPRRLRH
jgi:beta-fructofuranosidase